jgi:hypothetical protein
MGLCFQDGFVGLALQLIYLERVIVSNYKKRSLIKGADTVGQPPSAEIWVSKMPSLKAKKLRKLLQEKVLLER